MSNHKRPQCFERRVDKLLLVSGSSDWSKDSWNKTILKSNILAMIWNVRPAWKRVCYQHSQTHLSAPIQTGQIRQSPSRKQGTTCNRNSVSMMMVDLVEMFYLLWFLYQVPEKSAVHLISPLGAVAENCLKLHDAHPHVMVIVHHLEHGKEITCQQESKQEQYNSSLLHQSTSTFVAPSCTNNMLEYWGCSRQRCSKWREEWRGRRLQRCRRSLWKIRGFSSRGLMSRCPW